MSLGINFSWEGKVSSTKKVEEKKQIGELSIEEIQEIMDNAFPREKQKATEF